MQAIKVYVVVKQMASSEYHSIANVFQEYMDALRYVQSRQDRDRFIYHIVDRVVKQPRKRKVSQ